MNYTQFEIYTPENAVEGRLYWKSSEGKDWHEFVNELSEVENVDILEYSKNGTILSVNPDMSFTIPVGKSYLVVGVDGGNQTDEPWQEGEIPAIYQHYVILNGELVDLNLNVDILKKERWERIKQVRTEKSQGGTLIHSVGKWFHTDEKSMTHYLGLNQQRMMGVFRVVSWKTMDGSFVPLTEQLLAQVSNQVINNELLIFGVAEQHRMAMEALPNPLEYSDELISTLWPQVYEDAKNV